MNKYFKFLQSTQNLETVSVVEVARTKTRGRERCVLKAKKCTRVREIGKNKDVCDRKGYGSNSYL